MAWPAWNVMTAAAGGLLVLLLALLWGVGRWRWARATAALLAQLQATRQPSPPGAFDGRSLLGLPPPVQRYLGQVLREGQPLPDAVVLAQDGTFNTKPDGEGWKPFNAQQHVQLLRPGFVWDARISLAPGVAVNVHDAYIAGQGTLHAAVLGAVPVARLQGGGELAEGELMRWLAEAPWYPAALLPGRGVHWQAVDRHNADATLRDGELSVTLRFHFNSDGLVDTITAAARGRLVDGVSRPAPWQCRLWNYSWRGAQRVPLQGEAAWLLPGGASPYWRGRIGHLSFDVPA